MEWDNTVISMKDPGIFLGQTDITKCDMQDVIMYDADLHSTRESNEIVFNILHSTCAKDDIDNTSMATFKLDKINTEIYKVF